VSPDVDKLAWSRRRPRSLRILRDDWVMSGETEAARSDKMLCCQDIIMVLPLLTLAALTNSRPTRLSRPSVRSPQHNRKLAEVRIFGER
jgi:hypothetical protein